MSEPEKEKDEHDKEPKDLVDLAKKMHEGFYKGEINSDPDYKSPREHLRDYQENN